MVRRICWTTAAAVLCIAAVAQGEPADSQADSQDLDRTIRILRMQLREQERRLTELEGSQRSQQDQQRQQHENLLEVLKEMQADASERSTVPAWLQDLKFGGDMRLRFESSRRKTQDGERQKDRHRARFRLRFGLEKSLLDDQFLVGFRLATGSADDGDWDALGGSDPTSANQTFSGFWSQKPVWIDRAYVVFRPDAIDGLMVTAGKISNPIRISSLFMDGDVNPEGAWIQYTHKGFDSFQPFVGAGWFLAAESSGSDTRLLAYSAGFDWEVVEDVKWSMAASVLDFSNYSLRMPSRRGNTAGWDPEFMVLNVHNQVGFEVRELPVSVFFDFAHNFDEAESTSGLRGRNHAFHTGVKVGSNRRKGDWSASYEYAWMESNSLPGFWSSGDFGRTGRRGHIVKGAYNLADFLTVGGALFVTEPIRSRNGGDDIITLQADLVWKF